MDIAESFIWEEAFRPHTVAGCVLPGATKSMLLKFLEQGEVPNLFFYGPPGTGKTATARALVEQMDRDCMIVNASKDGDINTLRTRIQDFASQVSFRDGRKYVILDEAEKLTEATQLALRGFINEFNDNCGFILTANYPSKVIEALHSRCAAVSFDIGQQDRQTMMLAYLTRIVASFEQRNYDLSADNKKTIATVVKRYFPDFRRIWNELQAHSDKNGTIDPKVLSHSFDHDMVEFIVATKSKNVNTMAAWVFARADLDVGSWCRPIFDARSGIVPETAYGDLVRVLGDYQYKEAFVADRSVNFLAMMATIATMVV